MCWLSPHLFWALCSAGTPGVRSWGTHIQKVPGDAVCAMRHMLCVCVGGKLETHRSPHNRGHPWPTGFQKTANGVSDASTNPEGRRLPTGRSEAQRKGTSRSGRGPRSRHSGPSFVGAACIAAAHGGPLTTKTLTAHQATSRRLLGPELRGPNLKDVPRGSL